LRNIISIKIVCGHAQPQNNLPKMTVNNAIKTIKISIPKPKMKKSCAQKIDPNKINFFSDTLNKKSGSPLYFKKGVVKKTIK